MSALDSALTEEIVSDYESVRLTIDLLLAPMVWILYDILLTFDREVRYVWQSPSRKWHQRCLYVLSRYMTLCSSILTLGTVYPISNESCVALGWLINVVIVLASIGPVVFTVMRASALAGRNKLFSGVMIVLGMGVVVYTVLLAAYLAPVNLPPPDNCATTNNMSETLNNTFSIIGVICSVLGHLLATILTWRVTRNSGTSRQLGDTFSSGRASLPQILFEYGMLYFCALLVPTVTDSVLKLLSIMQPGQASLSYIGNFTAPIASILTGRFMLDIFEANAQLERGVMFNARLSSVAFDSGNLSTLDFVASYGGPAHSFFPDPDEDEVGASTHHDEALSSPEATPGGDGDSREAETEGARLQSASVAA
ncbi:hypothetical protein C8Q77DRAFT_1139178 [Trametes polyzona]|nr:hypothetical protein C8Q77DRAFT_1139178 [Trametes polyzona]